MELLNWIDCITGGIHICPIVSRNCCRSNIDDTSSDKVYADDTDHVKGFKYFSQFREFHQIEAVLKGEAEGRKSDTERILSYNIGLGLHDVLYASRIYDMLK